MALCKQVIFFLAIERNIFTAHSGTHEKIVNFEEIY